MSYYSTLAVAISTIWACQRCLVLLPHVQLYWTIKDLQFCFRTSTLSRRLNIWFSASTLLPCLDCQKPDATLPHFRSTLTAKDLKFRFRSVFTAKDLKFRVRTFVLPWLPKMWRSASALSLCLHCQICEVLLPHSRSAVTGKDLKFRFPHLFCQDFQRCEVPLPHLFCMHFQRFAVSLPHFRSILTAKDLKIGFSTNTMPSLPNMGSSAFKRFVVSHFRSAFIPKDVKALLLCTDRQSSASSLPL